MKYPRKLGQIVNNFLCILIQLLFYLGSEPTTSNSCLGELKVLFPDKENDELRSAACNNVCLNDAMDIVLSPSSTKIQCSTSSTKNTTTHSSFSHLLMEYREGITSEEYVLKIDRGEVWRTALGYYKKTINNPKLLWKSFEVRNKSLLKSIGVWYDKTNHIIMSITRLI